MSCVTDRGVGNGMSVLIFTSIISSIPGQGANILQQNNGGFVLVAVALLALVVIALVVFVEQAQRRIPVQYAKRQIGRRMYGGTSTYIPLKVNQAGVIPVIFASSLLYLPQLLSNVWASNETFDPVHQPVPGHRSTRCYLAIYFGLIVFFTYFYVAITFNPVEVSDNMKKYGGFVPGHPARPGHRGVPGLHPVPDHRLRGAVPGPGRGAALPAVQPHRQRRTRVPFGGTAVLIIVGVGLETVKQVESQLMLAQLRRLPAVVRLVLVGPARSGQGHAGPVHRGARRSPQDLHR